MEIIEINISFPLDNDGFFRRECPFCKREFKILTNKDERRVLAKKLLDSFMIESEEPSEDYEKVKPENEVTCPYCGQRAPKTSWWTKEQIEYIKIHYKNYANTLINERFIKELKRSFSGSKFMKFEAKELPLVEPWISPEIDDLEKFELPCCNQAIKINENWSGKVYCFFCGFPYDINKRPR
ncbi:Uncharacterised protein [uncultured archaeon]|nr:Uncharacterised protein [uncultured archaeon]